MMDPRPENKIGCIDEIAKVRDGFITVNLGSLRFFVKIPYVEYFQRHAPSRGRTSLTLGGDQAV